MRLVLMYSSSSNFSSNIQSILLACSVTVNFPVLIQEINNSIINIQVT